MNPREDPSAWFETPVRLEAAGKPIDTGDAWGHSSPWIADVDGDGLDDLIVGDISGKFRLFRNIGTNARPLYEPAGFLKAGGVDAEVWTY